MALDPITTDLDYLIPDVRIELNDFNEPYKYSDTQIQYALLNAIKMLGRRWRYRYLVSGFSVSRNPEITTFISTEPPTIEFADEYIIVLQATIIIKSADIYGSTWDIASWKDDEISYSNIQGARSRDDSISRDLELLNELLKQRLHPGKSQKLPGFHPPFNTKEGVF